MINLTINRDHLLLIIGTKEAQIYQQADTIDALQKQLIFEQQRNSELLKDRDMDAIQIRDLEGKVARILMMAEKVA